MVYLEAEEKRSLGEEMRGFLAQTRLADMIPIPLHSAEGGSRGSYKQSSTKPHSTGRRTSQFYRIYPYSLSGATPKKST